MMKKSSSSRNLNGEEKVWVVDDDADVVPAAAAGLIISKAKLVEA